ncbi:hypothetical protein H1P_360004 [Hyella patelloides LEGE 07179]|uniref:Uncharacterized protein n=1 Tax=Hyella patelloides LEGE 07179 TaxID=945734 RepID=A0A563VW39_9CYAN|nr:hypothetical protein H1P_360004 [Hyella patelloides LEGE 07179]
MSKLLNQLSVQFILGFNYNRGWLAESIFCKFVEPLKNITFVIGRPQWVN